MSAKPGTARAEELELWTLLVKVYEDEHWPIPPPKPLEALRFRKDQWASNRRTLVPYIGPRGRVSEVLRGHRSLTLAMVRRLSAGLRISAETLIGAKAADPLGAIGAPRRRSALPARE